MATTVDLTPTEAQRKAAVNAIVNKHAANAASEAEAEERSDSSKLKAVAALIPALSGGGSNDVLQEVLLELAASLREDREEKAKIRQDKLDDFNRLKKAQVENVRILHERVSRTQKTCSHTKEDGRTRLAGQKMHNGDLALMCNYCYKVFFNDEIPPHLMPRGEAMGFEG
jgi:hypothetical protein